MTQFCVLWIDCTTFGFVYPKIGAVYRSCDVTMVLYSCSLLLILTLLRRFNRGQSLAMWDVGYPAQAFAGNDSEVLGDVVPRDVSICEFYG